MAPLSVLPGRLRFEAQSLNGSKEGCLVAEERMRSVPGVREVSTSHRTGRVLVVFDESIVSRTEIEAHLDRALHAAARVKKEGAALPAPRRNHASAEASSHGVGHFVMEMALHAFLPAPLDLLLPTAAAFRR